MTEELYPRQQTQPTLLQRFLSGRPVTGVGMFVSKYLAQTGFTAEIAEPAEIYLFFSQRSPRSLR